MVFEGEEVEHDIYVGVVQHVGGAGCVLGDIELFLVVVPDFFICIIEDGDGEVGGKGAEGGEVGVFDGVGGA